MNMHWRMMRRAVAIAAAGVGAGVACAAPASAATYVYAFKGAPSTSGLPQSSVGAYDENVAVKVQVLRGGVAIDRYAASFDLASGDVIQVLNDATSALIASVMFDGQPALDATTCVGSASFAGTRTGNSTVYNVYAFKRERVTTPYTYDRDSDYISSQITTVNGSAFSGTFRKAVPPGYIVGASQTVLLSDGGTFNETVERPVGACPAPAPPPPPPAPPVPPADTTAPGGGFTLPAFVRRSALIGTSGLTVKTTITEPGLVRVDFYADNGAKLKTAAATAKKPKLVRLAGGQKRATAAGRVSVRVKTTKAGRTAIKAKKRTKAIVVTTLTDTAGNTKRLPVKKTTIK